MIEKILEIFNKSASITKNKCVWCDGLVRKINGIPHEISTVYLTGITENSYQTLIPHGVNAANILAVDITVNRTIKEYNQTPTTSNGYIALFDNENIVLSDVGTSCRNKPYTIKIEYKLET